MPATLTGLGVVHMVPFWLLLACQAACSVQNVLVGGKVTFQLLSLPRVELPVKLASRIQ